MKPLSTIAQAIAPSSTLAVDAMAKQMKAQGHDIIGFGTGEPDFNTPELIKQAGIDAINRNMTRYTPAAGAVELRKAVAGRLKADFDLDYDFTEITIASGAKHSVYIALCALLSPGDEVIIPTPYWVSYSEMVRMPGGVPVFVESTEASDFKITPTQLEAAITERSKVFLINNPSNPTGMLYTRKELEALVEVCVRHDLYIISDEIYYSLVYDNREFVSIPSLSEDAKARTILINGVSKAYAMTGWRIGYAAASKEISKVMANYLSHSTGAPGTMNQEAATKALAGPQEGVAEMCRVFQERRDYIVSRINAMEGVSCLKPEGAFYVMMNIEKLLGRTLGGKVIQNGDDFAMAFLEKGLVAVVPGSGFGAPNFLRFTYATSMENIKEGMDRLEAFLKA